MVPQIENKGEKNNSSITPHVIYNMTKHLIYAWRHFHIIELLLKSYM